MKSSFSALFRMATVSLCAVLVLSLAACGDKPSTSSDGDISAETTRSSVSTKKTKKKTTAATTAGKTTVTTADGAKTTAPQATTTTKKQYESVTKGTTKQWKKTTKAEPNAANYKLKATDYILNPEIHKVMYFGGSEAYPHVRWQGPFVDSSAGLYKRGSDLVTYSLEEYGFFNDEIFLEKPVSEWGFSFLMLQPGHKTGLGYELLPDVGYRLKTPKNRKEALAIIKDWLFRQYPDSLNENTEVWDTCTGYYLWGHYGLDFGASSIGAEVGESINHTQASIAFTRGGGRQYGVPTYIDISPWYGQTRNGHSASFNERHAMAAYMGGAGFVMAEGGEYCVLADTFSNGEYYDLNDVGKAYKKVIDFMNKYPNVGYTYTPFGLVFDYYHGMYPNERFSKKSFGYFPYEKGDDMSWELLNMFFPTGWESKWDESDYLVNGPYGDTCDALLQNASQEVLNSYPCLILSGNITLSNTEVNRYINYVKQGGTLVLNTAYLKYFSSYKSQYSGTSVKEIADEKGKVIVYGPDYDVTALDGIIKDQLAKLVPFTVTGGQVEHIVNIKNGAMYVTLINNEGYTKETDPEKKPVIDSSKKKNVTVTYTGNLAIKSASEIYAKNKVTLNGKSISITVKPGEIKVLEFKFD